MALPRNETASTPIAQPAPATATSTPASAGPPTSPIDVARVRREFALCRSSCGTVSWSNPVAAGAKSAAPAPLSACRPINSHSGVWPVITSRAKTPWLAKRASVRARSSSGAAVDDRRTPRRTTRAAPRAQARGLDVAHVGQRARGAEDREGHRHGRHAVPQHRHRMPAEIPAELAMPPSARPSVRHGSGRRLDSRHQEEAGNPRTHRCQPLERTPAHDRDRITRRHPPGGGRRIAGTLRRDPRCPPCAHDLGQVEVIAGLFVGDLVAQRAPVENLQRLDRATHGGGRESRARELPTAMTRTRVVRAPKRVRGFVHRGFCLSRLADADPLRTFRRRDPGRRAEG